MRYAKQVANNTSGTFKMKKLSLAYRWKIVQAFGQPSFPVLPDINFNLASLPCHKHRTYKEVYHG